MRIMRIIIYITITVALIITAPYAFYGVKLDFSIFLITIILSIFSDFLFYKIGKMEVLDKIDQFYQNIYSSFIVVLMIVYIPIFFYGTKFLNPNLHTGSLRNAFSDVFTPEQEFSCALAFIVFLAATWVRYVMKLLVYRPYDPKPFL